VVYALGAVAAVFGTTAGFDAEQRAHLYGVGIEVFAVKRLRPEYQVVKGLFKQ
jgi:hypothetical protein